MNALFARIGAHQVLGRADHEKQRALQRVVFGAIGVPMTALIGRHLNALPESFLYSAYVLGGVSYGLLNVAYWAYLVRRPKFGITAQYLFMVVDPVITVLTMLGAPHVLSWLSILLVIIIARTGMRYGPASMVASWIAAAVAATGAIAMGGLWERDPWAVLNLLASLCLVLLFIPVIRLQERLRDLDRDEIQMKALSDALNAKQVFLAQVSHELRTPLQSIVSALDVLEHSASPAHAEAESQAPLGRIRRACDHLSHHLRDLMTLAGDNVGRLRLRPQLVKLSEFFNCISSDFQEAAHNKGLALTVECAHHAGPVIVDAQRLRQIIGNLVTNAIKYTEQGSVTVHARFSSGRLIVDIADTGPGLDADERSRIFEPFVRGRSVPSLSEGAGIGLTVAQSLTQRMGGLLLLSSEPNKGTTVRVRIPAALYDEHHGEERHLLVVGEGPETAATLAVQIEGLGLAFDVAESPGEAVNWTLARRYQVIVLALGRNLRAAADFAQDVRARDNPNHDSTLLAWGAPVEGAEDVLAHCASSLSEPLTRSAITRWFVAQTPASVLT